jgi:tight adherence protein B
VEACRQLGWAPDLPRLWWSTRATALGAATVAAALWGIAGALVLGAGCWAGPRALTPVLDRRRLAERDRQLPDALERVAAAMRAGARPGPALAEVAADLPAPLGDELRHAVLALEHGDDLPTVLDRWAAMPGASPAVVLATSALGLGAVAGGQVARTVDHVAATLRERRQLQAEVRALATQARSSAWLLATAPLGFAGLVATIEPGVVSFLLTTPVGLACLALGLGLDAIGITWMARIVRGAT